MMNKKHYICYFVTVAIVCNSLEYICVDNFFYLASNCLRDPEIICISIIRWSKTIVGQVDLTAKLCLSFCLELHSAKSTYRHVDLDL